MSAGVKAVLLRCCIFAEDQYLMYYWIRPRRFGRLLGALCIFSLGCENIQPHLRVGLFLRPPVLKPAFV